MENDTNNTVLVDVEPRVRAVPNDVTDQSQTQRENVESRRVFEDLFDNSDAAIIDFDFSALFQLVRELKRNGVVNLRSYIAGSDERQGQLVGVVRVNNGNAAADAVRRALSRLSEKPASDGSRNAIDVTPEDLEVGLAKQQFLPDFQPKVSMADGSVAGFEALARWQHPEMGLIFPGIFIPIAERSGQIGALTDQIV